VNLQVAVPRPTVFEPVASAVNVERWLSVADGENVTVVQGELQLAVPLTARPPASVRVRVALASG
jgi:hypothetical protein